MANENMITVSEIARRVGATIYSVQRALDALGYQGEKRLSDRRSLFYPESVVTPVKNWLLNN